MEQQPDPRPGSYYVSVQRDIHHGSAPQTALLLGPLSAHQQALDMVDRVRAKACDLDPRAHWYSFGTCRMHDDVETPPLGILNPHFTEDSPCTDS